MPSAQILSRRPVLSPLPSLLSFLLSPPSCTAAMRQPARSIGARFPARAACSFSPTRARRRRVFSSVCVAFTRVQRPSDALAMPWRARRCHMHGSHGKPDASTEKSHGRLGDAVRTLLTRFGGSWNMLVHTISFSMGGNATVLVRLSNSVTY